jgi:hypothetical protein
MPAAWFGGEPLVLTLQHGRSTRFHPSSEALRLHEDPGTNLRVGSEVAVEVVPEVAVEVVPEVAVEVVPKVAVEVVPKVAVEVVPKVAVEVVPKVAVEDGTGPWVRSIRELDPESTSLMRNSLQRVARMFGTATLRKLSFQAKPYRSHLTSLNTKSHPT